MQNNTATGVSKFVQNNLAAQVRDSLLLNESVLVECVNEVLEDMPLYKAEVFRRLLKSKPAFGASVKRVTVDVGVVLSLAKSFESDESFAESAGLIHDVNFSGYDGMVGQYAKAMVESDLKMLEKAEAGELTEESFLYDMVPIEVLRRRLKLLLAFMDEAMKKSA